MLRYQILILLLTIATTPLISQTSPGTTFEKRLEQTGDAIQIMLPTTALCMTILKKDWEGTRQHAYAFGTNLLITYSLKTLINKKRPDPSTRTDALPSGHSSAAFQGASFIQKRYGWKYGTYAYALAAIVGYSRIEGINRRHDIWDVLAGAVVGIGSTYAFTKSLKKNEVELSFLGGNGYKMISLNCIL